MVIDDCGMKDADLKEVLIGVQSQGVFIKSFVYSNGEIGETSCQELLKVIPHLNELQLSNITKGGTKLIMQKILD